MPDTDREHTIGRSVEYTGVSLHTGKSARLRLVPAPESTGIVFVRVDLPGSPEVRATAANIIEGDRATTIGTGSGEVSVRTVEHLIAAIRGMSIDNIRCELDAEEVPMGDGSAATFVEMINEAGIVPQGSPRQEVVIDRPVWVSDGPRHLIALPYHGLKVTYVFDSDVPFVGVQHVEFEISRDSFVCEIAPARTVGFEEEIEALQARGLGLGGRADTVVVVGRHGYLGTLRFPDEIARHKVLDIIGDLGLAGPVRAHIVGIASGHSMNHRLARLIMGEC
ncbi:MAG TPA: UDP-3-O-[3-hydroxymyristoyl] N-acetylglucosamine deacetylase [Firmicutes bacterium]|nr:UDP-3-O-[3-hydroxymyristoyl] N-acetylglucosamine deacetylase [Bacillota bacterium]